MRWLRSQCFGQDISRRQQWPNAQPTNCLILNVDADHDDDDDEEDDENDDGACGDDEDDDDDDDDDDDCSICLIG